MNINILALNIDTLYYYYVGGIAGHNNGIITRSYVVGKIEVNNVPNLRVGGIAGYGNGQIEEVYTKGEIIAKPKYTGYVGGIIGSGDNISIINVYSEMDIILQSEEHSYIGGIVGYIADNSARIDKVYYIGNIENGS